MDVQRTLRGNIRTGSPVVNRTAGQSKELCITIVFTPPEEKRQYKNLCSKPSLLETIIQHIKKDVGNYYLLMRQYYTTCSYYNHIKILVNHFKTAHKFPTHRRKTLFPHMCGKTMTNGPKGFRAKTLQLPSIRVDTFFRYVFSKIRSQNFLTSFFFKIEIFDNSANLFFKVRLLTSQGTMARHV